MEPFFKEREPPRGIALPVAKGIWRIVAPNPSSMTYHGTNTYLVEHETGFVVIDPGPDSAEHVEAIVKATGGRIEMIVLTHWHNDHTGAAKALKQCSGAPTVGFREFAHPDLAPDIRLDDGETIAGMVAIHTPGHASDHLCLAQPDGLVFTGDHIMGWASTVVWPPSGDMAQYYASLELMLARDDRQYLPGHGPAVPEPRLHVRQLLERRQRREAAILRSLTERRQSSWDLVERFYGSKTDPRLRTAAERNVWAHLLKLSAEGLVVSDGESWVAAE